MADLIERLRAKAALSIPPHAPHLLPPGFRTPVYDAEMRALLTEAADALAQRAEGGEAVGALRALPEQWRKRVPHIAKSEWDDGRDAAYEKAAEDLEAVLRADLAHPPRAVSAVGEDAVERMARAADTLDNLIHAMAMPLPDSLHMTAIRSALPGLLDEMRAALTAAGVGVSDG